MNDGGFFSHGVDLLQQGGPAMYVLLAMSIGVVAIILAKLVQFGRLRLGDTATLEHALQALRGGDEAGAEKILQGSPSPVARVLETARATAKNPHLTPEDRDAQVSAQGAEELGKLSSWLRSLELLGNLSPLVGLLGTVGGMIAAFAQLELAGSQVDPSLLAGGIWEALLTTAFGLIVAIPAVAAFSLFEARIDGVRRQMRSSAIRLMEYYAQDRAVRLQPEGRREGASVATVAHA